MCVEVAKKERGSKKEEKMRTRERSREGENERGWMGRYTCIYM